MSQEKEMKIAITVAPENLNNVLAAIRATGFRHVELDQVEDAVKVSLTVLPTDVAQVLRVVEGTKAKEAVAHGYDSLSQFASARPRNRHGQFVNMQGGRKGSQTLRKTGS